MKPLYTLALALTSLVLVSAQPLHAQDKVAGAHEKLWNPVPNSVQADVPEVEPNNGIANAQLLQCGDVLRPAAIDAPADTDYVYFSVVAGTIITVGTDADGAAPVGDTRIRLFDASAVVLANDDDSGPGLYSLLTYTAPTSGIYYVGFAAYSATSTGSYKGFVSCQAPQPPPVNDQCTPMARIDCGDINLSGSTAFAADDYTPLTSGVGGCTGYAALGKDVAYLMSVSGGDQLDATYTSTADASIYIITDCSSPTTTCVAGADATLTGAAEHLVYTFPASGEYYLILDSYGTNSSGTWTLTGILNCTVVPANRRSWGQVKTIYR